MDSMTGEIPQLTSFPRRVPRLYATPLIHFAKFGQALTLKFLLPLFNRLGLTRAALDVILCAFDIAITVGACGQFEFPKSPIDEISLFVSTCK